MTRFARYSSSTALAICLGSTAAYADLTAAEVWNNWRDYMSDVGYEVTGAESQSGDTLTISDVRMRMEIEGEGDTADTSITMDTLTFTDVGDGSVSVEIPAVSKITVDADPASGETFDMTLDYTQSGFVMVVTGDREDMTYTYSADTMGIALAELMVDDEAMDRDTARASVTIADLSGVSRVMQEELRNVSQTLTTGPVTYDIAFTSPDDDGAATITGGMETLAFTGGGNIPTIDDPSDMNAMIEAGFNFLGEFTFEQGNSNIEFDGPDGGGTMNTSSIGGALSVSMSEDGLSYSGSQSGLVLKAMASQMPIPIDLNMETLGFGMVIPVQKSEEPQDFGLTLALEGFTMSEVLWGMFDPQAQLPRDPATIAVDLAGKTTLDVDLLDPQAAAAMETSDAAPGELNALDIRTLTVEAAGAELNGTGSFTFDNSDMTTFDGMPKPVGSLDLTLVGGNGLLDKLVAMGLLPEQQAQGARMMMGLFAVPGDAPDTLNSTIEVNEAGQVLANGQRIR
ncbi:DUF2125 domain-containing protein [Pseudosulfitobacter koreensis]|uniref:DUF2125 domain-containing protein n=1 Tax=Pseudosulfitobacter koreensis TaxID=2968472 RepID=A0ABT1Z139_9RHOB|nr:DUF2125 domain-containing protein [Pseudosulfitobacter koreense]MCR8826837.1 DUF2125 domain-containing protein [Pseudosulfitobacter koreense]